MGSLTLLPALFGLTLFAAPAVSPGTVTETVHNERVTVVDVKLSPRETEPVQGAHPTLTVYLTPGSLEVVPPDGNPRQSNVQRGDVLFEEAGRRTLRNVGSSVVHFVRVEFLGEGSATVMGAAGLSPNYKMLLENRHTRVYDIRIPAGGREPQHSHGDRVVVCLAGAKMTHLLPDGSQQPSTLKTGESAWRRGGTHIGQNLDTVGLWVIAVEPK